MLEIEVAGLKQYKALVGLAGEAFSPDDLELVIQGLFRETPLPDGSGPVVEKEFTVVGAVERQFETGGRNAYRHIGWVRYGREPVYAAYKKRRNAGDKPGTWGGSKNPLARTFLDKNDPDHVEFVDGLGGMIGSRRPYAATFSVGGPETPFDKIPQPERKIQPITDPGERFGFQAARAAQRVLVAKMGQAPGEPGAPLPRVEP